MEIESATAAAAESFGYATMKPEQRVVSALVSGNDVFVSLPTGFGYGTVTCKR